MYIQHILVLLICETIVYELSTHVPQFFTWLPHFPIENKMISKPFYFLKLYDFAGNQI